MLHRSISTTVCAAVFIASALTVTPATAAEDGPDGLATVDAVAELVSAAAPADSTAAADSLVELKDSGTDLQGGSVRLSEEDGILRHTASGVTVQLPSELETQEAEVADNNMIVYAGESSEDPAVAVATTGQNVAIQVLIPDASAPMRHSYDIEGASLELLPDGSVALLDGEGASLGYVDAPWAIDAAGNEVDTRYEVEGDTLVQVVEPTATTQFPVVADPDFIFMAKCTAAIALFAAENAALIGKFWRVFKSAKKLAELFWDIRKMSRAGKMTYLRSKLGSIASELSGWSDLITRCTP